ncbi:hypothetical protein MKZ38_006271 [Zalerion maritima]|uniref:Flavin-containing monooxygenase n=1 Tax=Zalerion maritima TaxID=339359 RepID=A0AAD5WPR1_9PEZI|nr:hypothetical protein MKZ38_006271 [Zalerion maritima]
MGDAASHEAKKPFTIKEETIENLRPMKVICIGAGFSGIFAAIRYALPVKPGFFPPHGALSDRAPSAETVAHSYQYSFAPNPYWSDLYAPGAEIQKYLKGVAEKYGATRFIKTKHEVTKHVTVKNLATGETIEDKANVVIAARGLLNEISWPDIEGLRSFKGKIMHSGDWDESNPADRTTTSRSHDFRNQRIGVIGNGSSAIQIIPKLQKIEGTHLTCFGRSPTWISGAFGDVAMAKLQDEWSSSPGAYLAFRKVVEDEGASVHEATLLGSPMQKAGQEYFAAAMKTRLSRRPDLSASMIPKFAPGCRRLTPGPGYLEALCEPNVEFLREKIAAVGPSGLGLGSGREVRLDALVCATGFKTSSPPPFPVVGRNSLSLSARWESRPDSYLSVAVDGFPNYFIMFGPNSAIGSGSLTMILESQGEYVVKCLRKLQKEDYSSMEVLPARVKDFQEYCGAYFSRTVYADECESWYKNKSGRTEEERKWVSGVWPGSSLQAVEAFRSPRWEDYRYESLEEEEEEEEAKKKNGGGTGNRMRWLGDGWTTAQKEGDKSFYINPEFVDMPVEGKPEEREEYKKRPWSY